MIIITSVYFANMLTSSSNRSCCDTDLKNKTQLEYSLICTAHCNIPTFLGANGLLSRFTSHTQPGRAESFHADRRLTRAAEPDAPSHATVTTCSPSLLRLLSDTSSRHKRSVFLCKAKTSLTRRGGVLPRRPGMLHKTAASAGNNDAPPPLKPVRHRCYTII